MRKEPDDPSGPDLLPASGISGPPFGPVELLARVAAAIAGVRPMLQADGGDVTLVGVRGDTAYVRLIGACSGCSAADRTMVPLVDHAVRAGIPEITHTVLLS